MVWNLLLPLMNSLNKTEAAFFQKVGYAFLGLSLFFQINCITSRTQPLHLNIML